MKVIQIVLILLLFIPTVYSQTYEIDAVNGQTINTCSGTFYDSGGASSTYNNNENYTVTFCSDMPGAQIIFTFTSFTVENVSYDNLTIYDGANTSSPIIGVYGGGSLLSQIIQSGSGCLTFEWSSDFSGFYAGWTANISCSTPAQEFEAFIASASVPNFTGDTIRACPGQDISFTAGANFPNNNINYNQTLANTVFEWDFGDGSAVQTGLNVNHTYNNSGGYLISLLATDVNGNTNSNLVQNYVLVANTPNFAGTTITPETICLGETVNLNGFVQSDIWFQSIPSPYSEETFLPDNASGFYQTGIEFEIFDPGQTLTNVNEILDVCINMEHSYLGDLTIQLICPSGQSVNFIVFPNGMGGMHLGEPIDLDGNLNPGIGYEYCFSPTSTSGTLAENYLPWITTLPAGTYEAVSPWTNLLGCPLNGDWQIYIYDNLPSDNGYIFEWMINFDPAIFPSSLLSIENSYPTSNMQWVGENITVDNNNTAVAQPVSIGSVEYSFTVLDDFGCAYDTSLFVNVLPIGSPGCCIEPIAYAGADDEVCGFEYSLSAVLDNPSGSGNWSFSGSGTAVFSDASNPNSSVSVGASGVYSFTWTESIGVDCESSDEVTITFLEIPTSTFSITNIPCFGDSAIVTYTGSASSTAFYDWNFGDAINNPSGQGPHLIYWNSSGYHNISLTVTDNTCVSEETTENILMPEELNSIVNTGNIECPGGVTSISIIANGGTGSYSYNWDPNPGSLTNVGSGTYNLTISDNNGCSNYHNFTINEPPGFVYDNHPVNLLCNGDFSGTIDIDYAGGTLPYSFQWSGPSGFNASTEDISALAAGTYNIFIEDSGGCTLSDEITITQPNVLNAQIVSSTNISCFGNCDGSAIVTATGGTPPYSCFWETLETSTFASDLCAGITYVSITDANNCQAATSVEIFQPDLLTIEVLATNVNCYGESNGTITVNTSGGTPPFSFNYSPSLLNTGIQNNLSAGAYNLTVSDANNCNATAYVVISEPSSPLNLSYIQTNPICFGENTGSIDISVSGGTPNYTYNWSDSLSSEDLSNLSAGIYSLTLTDSNGCTAGIGTEIIQPERIKVVCSEDQTICINESAVVSATATGGTNPYTYHWSNYFSAQTQVVSPSQSQSYSITVTDINGCTSNIETVNINVHDSLILKLYTQDNIICEGQPAVIHSFFDGGNGGPYILTENGEVVVMPYIVYPTGTSTFTFQLNDMCTTPAVLDSIKIEVIKKPEISFNWDNPAGCEPHHVSFNGLSSPNHVNYYWDFGDNLNNFSTKPSPSHLYANDGVYDVSLTVTDTVNGCKSTIYNNGIITVYPLPKAEFLPEPQIASILNPTIYFHNNSELNFENTWYFGLIDSSNSLNPEYLFSEVGNYNVTLFVKTEYGCVDSTTVWVKIKDEFTFYAPTAFTPNRNATNDIFTVFGYGIDPGNFKMLIYNRWGELVFETDKYNPDNPYEYGWNGQIKSENIGTTGVYKWLVIYKDLNGIQHERTGNVTLIR
ncbi:MAG: PKD domain-containing protein [Bacteroidales bacterium]|nr:PKD domain-containing protein [Bacteroidales bacterium]